MDPYFAVLAVIGVAVVAAALLRCVLVGAALSAPMLYLLIGMGLFALPVGLDGPRPGPDDQAAMRLTEIIVIVSLMGAGLKLNRPMSWRAWRSTRRLILVTMPLTIGAVTLLGLVPLQLSLASAVLLGAIIAPTDPVLASDVQVEGPVDDEEADDEVRFALTSEAGLNDAFAFPFTMLAIAIAGGGDWLAGWIVNDVLIRIGVGVVAGWILGRVLAWLMFRARLGAALARTSAGFVVIGATLAVYAVTELVHGYGFLAVFLAAVTIRNQERDHDYHQVLHDFASTVEELASIVFLLLLGGAVVDGGLASLTVAGAVVAVITVVLVRPLAGWIGLLGSGIDTDERAAIAFFGLRGMGSIYYLSYAASAEVFPAAGQVWAVSILIIVLSIMVHGVSSSAVLRTLDRRRGRRTALTT